jgi:D-lyxose ketol-isomerase
MGISKEQYKAASERAMTYFERAGIAITEEEQSNIEVADFGLGQLGEIGVELIIYANTQRVCAKEVVLFPNQICPEHRHPPFDGTPGKEETFRCRWGVVYLYVEGPHTAQPKAIVPDDRKAHFTVWHEVILHPGDQYLVPPNTLHWFQAGPEGAVLSEFSTPSSDAIDVFTDPDIVRIPEVY